MAGKRWQAHTPEQRKCQRSGPPCPILLMARFLGLVSSPPGPKAFSSKKKLRQIKHGISNQGEEGVGRTGGRTAVAAVGIRSHHHHYPTHT